MIMRDFYYLHIARITPSDLIRKTKNIGMIIFGRGRSAAAAAAAAATRTANVVKKLRRKLPGKE